MIYLQANITPFSLPDFKAMWETLAGLGSVWILVGVGLMALLLIGGITLAGGNYKLSSIKSRMSGPLLQPMKRQPLQSKEKCS